MNEQKIKQLLKGKGEQLTQDLEDFARNELRLPDGKQLRIQLSVINVPVEKNTVLEVKTRLGKGTLLEDELTEDDWALINNYEFDAKSKIVVEYYRLNGNQPMSFNQLAELGVITDPSYSQRFGQIQVVFNKNGGRYGLRRKNSSRGYDSRKKDPYKIYKIDRNPTK